MASAALTARRRARSKLMMMLCVGSALGRIGLPGYSPCARAHGVATVTGGTGRFAGATGIITREGLNNADVSVLGGTISTPGASKK